MGPGQIALGGLALGACVLAAALPAAGASRPTVVLRDVQFHPRTLHVSPGATVRFSWQDHGVVHNVAPVGSKRFKLVVGGKTRARSGERRSGSVTTTKLSRGTYTYVCTIHALPDANGRYPAGSMTGKIVVG